MPKYQVGQVGHWERERKTKHRRIRDVKFHEVTYVSVKWKLGFFFLPYFNSNFNHNKCAPKRIKAQEVPIEILNKMKPPPKWKEDEKKKEKMKALSHIA
jgi:hypothetical protein